MHAHHPMESTHYSIPSFRDGPKDQTRNLEIPGSMRSLSSGRAFARTRWHRPGMTNATLPHHPRGKPGLAARRLDFLFQEAVRFLADIAGARKSPGAAFVVFGAGRLAGLVALAALHCKSVVIAAGAVDRGFLRAVAWLHHAGAAHA